MEKNATVSEIYGSLVFSDRVMRESHEAQAAIARHKKDVSYDSGSEELLSADEQNELERIMIEQELEEETAALNEEIDRIIEGMM